MKGAKIPTTFWKDFFKGPVQLALEDYGSSLEEFVLYAIIHHDHHFFCEWASESYITNLDFDNIRDEIETEFHYLYKFVRIRYLDSVSPNLYIKLIRMVNYFSFNGAHINALKLAGYTHTGEEEFERR